MKKKMGRPRLSTKGVAVAGFSVRMPAEEVKAINDAIQASGKSKPDWLRSVLLRAARKKTGKTQ
jgi:hypothetical protein